ncbi:MAG: anion transporter [Euryarchaeota archaeon]|nr:anion transporter [Euryarchaeota archaeon]
MADLLNIPVIVLVAVFILIAVRQVGRTRLRIWQIMLFGALAVLITGQIHPADALLAINLDVMLFLFGMFVVGEALYESGYLFHIAHKAFKGARNADQLILLVLFTFGILSSFLMNDTLAIIGAPLVLHLATKFQISPKLLLLSLAFAVTTGSVMSPIGNPQNLLVALNGNISNPFLTFFSYLLVPTIINLLACYLVLRLFFKDELRKATFDQGEEGVSRPRLALACKLSLSIIFVLIAAKVLLSLAGVGADLRLTYIALLAAVPILAIGDERMRLLRNIDWQTLIFFGAMFVLMASVWQSGLFQAILATSEVEVTGIPVILGISVLLSQFISNVPFVALYLPMLLEAGASTAGLMALAAGSTIAGNLLILGAASNVIIIQGAEKRGATLTFLDFAKVGVPLTAINIAVYWFFLEIL